MQTTPDTTNAAHRDQSTPPDIDHLPDQTMLTGHDVDAILAISLSARLRLEKSGQLKVHRFGRSKRYRVADVRALIHSSSEAA